MRLYRENIALGAQLDGLQWHFERMKAKATHFPFESERRKSLRPC